MASILISDDMHMQLKTIVLTGLMSSDQIGLILMKNSHTILNNYY